MTVTSPAKQSLSKQFPHIAKQWHPKKNGSLNPSSVAPFHIRKSGGNVKEGTNGKHESPIAVTVEVARTVRGKR